MIPAHGDPARRVAELIQTLTGVQLPPDKDALIRNRLTRRMLQVGVRDLPKYLGYLEGNLEVELPYLISNLTTHTTEFFRDAEHFEDLAQNVLPEAIRRSEPIRIWSAACSTGEEVYSLAMSIQEFLDRQTGCRDYPWEVMGTDVDGRSVATASRGIYATAELTRLRPELLSRYFDLGKGELAGLARVRDPIWKHCSFRPFNLLSDRPDAKKWTSIFVRNVFIYFKHEDIQRVAAGLAASLSDYGRLYLGSSEFLNEKESGLKRVGKATYSRPVSEGKKRIRVMVVDDSKTIRSLVKEILSPSHGFEVVAEAEDPIVAMELLKHTPVDVMTLDIHMPRMDGVEYLKTSRSADHPPIVMMSSVSEHEAVKVFRCLDLGATDYIEKPKGNQLAIQAGAIRSTVRAVGESRRKKRDKAVLPSGGGALQAYDGVGSEQQLIAIGASTGGIEAIREILPEFPRHSPPILIVQHIPDNFSAMFANRLQELCSVVVKEAVHDDILTAGTAYIAPGGKQLSLQKDSHGMRVILTPAAHGDLYHPCIDAAFASVAEVASAQRISVSAAILTGMGRDGAEGLRALRGMGAHTVAQDEATSTIYGMPKAAVELGAAVQVLPLEKIPEGLFSHFVKKVHARKTA